MIKNQSFFHKKSKSLRKLWNKLQNVCIYIKVVKKRYSEMFMGIIKICSQSLSLFQVDQRHYVEFLFFILSREKLSTYEFDKSW